MFSTISNFWRHRQREAAFARQAIHGARTAGIPTFRQAFPRLGEELRRARRYERPLAFVAVGLEKLTVPQDGSNSKGSPNLLHLPAPAPTHLSFFLLGSLLRDTIRESDVMAFAAEHHLYVLLLPESAEYGAQQAVARISRVIDDRARIHLRTGIAEFPRDGYTVDDLFGSARNRFKHQLRLGPIPIVREQSNG